MNDPRGQGNWQRLAQPPSRPAPSAIEQQGAGALLVLTNRETILRCREEGTAAQDCLGRIMVQNGIAASVAMAAQLLSEGAMVKLALMAEGGAFIMLGYQTLNLLYNLEDLAAAEWNRYQTELARREWAERNLRNRDMGADIEALRSRIGSTLDPLVTAIQSGCRRLEDNATQASESGAAAQDALGRLPQADSIEAYKQYEDKVYAMMLRQRGQSELMDKVRKLLDQVKQDLSDAAAGAETCTTAEASRVIADKHAAAVRGFQTMQRLSAESETAAPEDGAGSGIRHARSVLTDAFATRDQINRLCAAPVSRQQMETLAAGVNTAVQQLNERGARLINEVGALRNAYPDDLKAETEYLIHELEQIVICLQNQPACDPEPAKVRGGEVPAAPATLPVTTPPAQKKALIMIDAITVIPAKVTAGELFEVRIELFAETPQKNQKSVVVTLLYAISQNGRIAKRFDPETFDALNGEPTILHKKTRFSKTVGKYEIHVELQLEGQRAEMSTVLPIE